MVRSVNNDVLGESVGILGTVVGEKGAAVALAPPPPSPASLSSGGGICNTPSKCRLGEFSRESRLLHFGVDTLRVGFDIEWSSASHALLICELDRCLNVAKEARSIEIVNLAGFGEVEFYPSASGAMRNYQYHFRLDNAHFFLSNKRGGSKTGNGMVQYGAEWCHAGNISERHTKLLDRLCCIFLSDGRREWVNRIDVAADVYTASPVDHFSLAAYRVPTRISASAMGDSATGHSLYLGKRNSRISCCIYEKGKLVKSGKNPWFRGLWELADNEPIENVHRIEYRYNRDWVREVHGDWSVFAAELSASSLFHHGLNKLRCGTLLSRPRESDPHELFAIARAVPLDLDAVPFNRLRPADKLAASLDDFLAGPLLRCLRQYRKAADLASDLPLRATLEHLMVSVTDSAHASAAHGVGPAPF